MTPVDDVINKELFVSKSVDVIFKIFLSAGAASYKDGDIAYEWW